MSCVKALPIFALLIAALFATSDGYKKCRKVRPTHVDEEWVKEIGESDDGWYFPMHSNCDNCERNEAFKWLMKGRAIQEEMCWKTNILTKFGPMQLPFNCKYSRFEEQSCVLDTSGLRGKAEKKLGFGAEMILTLTDNKTFIAGASCIFGKENWWWVASTDEELSEDTKERVDEHFQRLGFNPDNVAEEGNWKKSPIIFKTFHLTSDSC